MKVLCCFAAIASLIVTGRPSYKEPVNDPGREPVNVEFDRIDADGGGTLSLKEVVLWAKAKVENCDPKATSEFLPKFSKFFKTADKDNDGSLDRQEYIGFWKEVSPVLRNRCSPAAFAEAIYQELSRGSSVDVTLKSYGGWAEDKIKGCYFALPYMAKTVWSKSGVNKPMQYNDFTKSIMPLHGFLTKCANVGWNFKQADRNKDDKVDLMEVSAWTKGKFEKAGCNDEAFKTTEQKIRQEFKNQGKNLQTGLLGESDFQHLMFNIRKFFDPDAEPNKFCPQGTQAAVGVPAPAPAIT